MPVIVFNGPPGSGKDEAAKYLERNYGFKHLSFKYQLFSEAFKHFGVEREWFMDGYDDRSIKDRPETRLDGLSRRGALIHVSEEILKPIHGKGVFGAQVAAQLSLDQNYTISDCGFTEELQEVINIAGASVSLVQLLRDGCSYSNDSRRYVNGSPLAEEIVIRHRAHMPPAELLPVEVDIRTYRIHNNGTLSEFHQAVRDISARETDAKESIS